jgi:type I restriction enzyme M protein
LFSELAKEETQAEKQFHSGRLGCKVLTHIEQSTMGAESEDDFGNLFADLDLTSHKRNLKPTKRTDCQSLVHLDEIDFDLENTDSDVLGDAMNI